MLPEGVNPLGLEGGLQEIGICQHVFLAAHDRGGKANPPRGGNTVIRPNKRSFDTWNKKAGVVGVGFGAGIVVLVKKTKIRGKFTPATEMVMADGGVEGIGTCVVVFFGLVASGEAEAILFGSPMGMV